MAVGSSNVLTGRDIVMAGLNKLEPSLTNLMFSHEMSMGKILGGGIVQSNAQGLQHIFDVQKDAPGTWTLQQTGSEIINSSFKDDMLVQGYAPDFRAVLSVDIPNPVLDRQALPEQVHDLFNLHVISALEKASRDILQQFYIGHVIALDGTEDTTSPIGDFFTLAGDTTWLGGASGFLDFAAAASQTSTVFGLVKRGGASGLRNWYNQYGLVTDTAYDGWKTLRRTYAACQTSTAQMGKGPNVGVADETSYYNLREADNSYVRIENVEMSPERKIEISGLKFENCMIYPSKLLDPSWMNGGGGVAASGRQGVMYLLSTDTMNFINFVLKTGIGKEGKDKNKLIHRECDLTKRENIGMSYIRWVMDCGFMIKDLQANATLEGFWNTTA